MISILMATRNGAAYLPGQIASILRQTEQGFTLHIHDDRSTDDTYTIACACAAENPGRVVASLNAHGSGSARDNFLSMMLAIKDDYVMLSDQDDVWLPEKVQKTLAAMRDMEALYGKDTPLLVHADAAVTDERLQAIAPSFREYSNIHPERDTLRDMVIQNMVTGHTMMYNRALAGLIQTKPQVCFMHDWWAALIASAFGHIHYIDEPLSLYRQHSGNEIGASDIHAPSYAIRRALSGQKIRSALWESCAQAGCFLEIFEEGLTEADRQLLSGYAAIPQKGKLGRVAATMRLGVWKTGLVRRVAQVLFI